MAYTALEAVEIALNLLGKPSSVREITNYILQNKLWKTSGKTPDATVRERIYRDSQKNGKKSKICKVGRGIFDLRERHEISQPLEEQLEYIVSNNSLEENSSVEINVPEAEEQQPKTVEENTYYNVSEVKKILRDRLINMSPSAFEHLIGKLLEAIGFRADVTKASHDGGVDVRGELVIDNVIRVKMSVQAKRYKIGNNVQTPVVQQLRGSVNTVELERGLPITTSDFTKGAYKEAEAYGKANIDLMNGEKLVELLLKYEIGVKSQKVYTIDESMFSDLATLSSAQSPIS